jgi:D-xylonolactonase
MQGGVKMSNVAISEPVSIWQLGAPLGEGPIWVERDQALWFVDIKSHKIHRLDPATGATRSWDAPGQVGFILPIESGGFVAGLQTGLARFDERDGSFTAISAPGPDLPTNRLNDATVDPQGRLWFGSMDDGESDLTGAIYRLGSDGTCINTTDHVAITNGPAISPDGKTLYHVDTLVGEGHPDGPTVDSEGCVWVGLYNGWAVRRYSPAGELLETVKFPVSAITKIAFGGPDGKTVFATTANKHIAPGDLAKQPHAGDLFRFEVSVPGQKNYLIREGV